MSDQIHIKDLHLRTIIGINEEERRNRQDVLINLVLDVDTRLAGESDDIDQAVNYRTISRSVRDFVEASNFGLIEKLADGVARLCLEDERVQRVDVRLRKPGALRLGRTVGLDITRHRSG